MAAPSYTTDLVDIDNADINTTYTNLGTGADATETDYFIQGTACVSKPFNITAGGIYHNEGAAVTFATDEVFWLWSYFAAPNALKTEALGGMQALVGSSGTAYRLWNIFGSDNYTYGGWRCFPVDVVNVAADVTVGAPTATRQYFGVYANTTVGIGKGNPLGLDAMRKGRGESRMNGGDLANGYATFAGFAAVNDSQTNRWGLCQYDDGSYRVQGMMVFGFTTAVDFRDSNKNLIINNTKKVSANFNRFEVRQVGSRVDLTNINITSLGTVARGNFECIDDADVNIEGCAFTDMGTFVFKSASTILNTTFRRTGQITQGGATFTGCTFANIRDAVSVLASAPSSITFCDFISDGSNHAIQIATAGSYTLTGNSFTGYATANGSTGNEAIYVSATTGTVTINTDTAIFYRTAGATVVVVAGQKTLTLTGIVTGSDVVILAAGTTTELANIDATGSSSYAYSYTYSAGTFIDVCVYKAGYIPFTVRNYLLANGDGSLPISQVIDRNYLP